jgi:hypothetical protein
MVNVNLVVEKKVKTELNTHHVAPHQPNVKPRVKVKSGGRPNS